MDPQPLPERPGQLRDPMHITAISPPPQPMGRTPRLPTRPRQQTPHQIAVQPRRQPIPQPTRQQLLVHTHAHKRHRRTQTPRHPHPPHLLNRLQCRDHRQPTTQQPQILRLDQPLIKRRRQSPQPIPSAALTPQRLHQPHLRIIADHPTIPTQHQHPAHPAHRHHPTLPHRPARTTAGTGTRTVGGCCNLLGRDLLIHSLFSYNRAMTSPQKHRSQHQRRPSRPSGRTRERVQAPSALRHRIASRATRRCGHDDAGHPLAPLPGNGLPPAVWTADAPRPADQHRLRHGHRPPQIHLSPNTGSPPGWGMIICIRWAPCPRRNLSGPPSKAQGSCACVQQPTPAPLDE